MNPLDKLTFIRPLDVSQIGSYPGSDRLLVTARTIPTLHEFFFSSRAGHVNLRRSSFGHDQVCEARIWMQRLIIYRNNALLHAPEDALETASGTRIEVVPTSRAMWQSARQQGGTI